MFIYIITKKPNSLFVRLGFTEHILVTGNISTSYLKEIVLKCEVKTFLRFYHVTLWKVLASRPQPLQTLNLLFMVILTFSLFLHNFHS